MKLLKIEFFNDKPLFLGSNCFYQLLLPNKCNTTIEKKRILVPAVVTVAVVIKLVVKKELQPNTSQVSACVSMC